MRGIRSTAVIVLLSGVLVLAHAALGPRLQVFFAADFTDQTYQKKTYSRVAGSWKMPKKMPAPGAKAVVKIIILKDGRTPAPTLHHQSGSDAWDAAALEALRSAKPFSPLPKDYRRESVEVHFHFIYDE